MACGQSVKLDFSLDFFYSQSEVIRYLEVAGLIGAPTVVLEPIVKVLPDDKAEVRSFMASLKHRPFIVLHPIAVDVRRMWPLENYARLADELRLRNFEVVFTGSQEDKDSVDDVINKMNYTAINVCGDFSLGGLTAVISKAFLMIATDTGPLHLARAVGTPTIGFYWATNLVNWGPLTRGRHRPLVSWTMACPRPRKLAGRNKAN